MENYDVRVKGLEPISLAAPDPKSGASTNFAIPAFKFAAKIGNRSRKSKF